MSEETPRFIPITAPSGGSPPAAAPSFADLFDLAATAFKGRLNIERVVGATDERALLSCHDTVLKRRVALRLHLMPGTPGRRWFEKETELLASLDHPAIRTTFAGGYEGAIAWRISKWIEGESLAEAVARGPRSIPTVVTIARDLTAALEYAHTEHLVIRRIIPDTLMVDRADRPVITDLRFANGCLGFVALPDAPSSEPFIAPEARGGKPGEPAADIYAAGALLYYAMTGVAPALDPNAIRPARELRPNCPRVIERVIMRALRGDPGARYLSAAEMAEDLASDLGDYEVPNRLVPLGTGADDSRMQEKRLRRAFGDEYELLDELGAGGFGRVYRVRDLRLERDVALKILHPFLTANPAVVERFRKEAQLAARLDHPNIVQIFDIGGRGGLLWYTMEYVNGKSLAYLVDHEGPFPLDRVTRVMLESLSALQHAHAGGLVHRDIKPENIMLDGADGGVRIADFGLALAFGGERFGGASSSRAGTPEFAAPEQLMGENVDARADLYSLSAVGYFALTGNPPYPGGTIESIAARQAAELLPDLSEERKDVPDWLGEILEKGASHRPADRFQTADEYAATLRRAIQWWQVNPMRWVKEFWKGK
ncbi:MAG: serine/threonine protein kinase [Gemmatimonadetes bacterium]|nr:serine/threonine protein kinase [Gemmatimonadota bacterium]